MDAVNQPGRRSPARSKAQTATPSEEHGPHDVKGVAAGLAERPLRGLGLTYFTGLGSLLIGCALLPGAIVGLLGIILFFAGIVLIWIAIVRLEGAQGTSHWRLPGGLILCIGMLGTIPLAFVSAFAALTPAGARVEPSWIMPVGLAATWVAWPGLICIGVWLRKRPAPSVILLLWLSLSATCAAITGLSLVLFPYLPWSL